MKSQEDKIEVTECCPFLRCKRNKRDVRVIVHQMAITNLRGAYVPVPVNMLQKNESWWWVLVIQWVLLTNISTNDIVIPVCIILCSRKELVFVAKLPMTGFELGICGDGNDHSTNSSTAIIKHCWFYPFLFLILSSDLLFTMAGALLLDPDYKHAKSKPELTKGISFIKSLFGDLQKMA